MPLNKEQLEMLISSVANTRPEEIACDDCLAGMAEFADVHLLGAEIPDALEAVQAHLASCGECAEEYEVLLDALSAAASDTSGPVD